jgi:glycogen synthase
LPLWGVGEGARPAMRVALVSRELYPFGGGGIGEYIAASAQLMCATAEITIFTTDEHRATFEELRSTRDPRLPPDDVSVVFIPEAREEEVGGYFSALHLYASRVLGALRDHYGGRGPDLVEFSDYLGEGAVAVQARRTGDPLLRRSVTAIRLHTSAEVCAVLDGHIDDNFTTRITCELERVAIRDADYLLWPGGDTLSFYHRFYGPRQVAPGQKIRNPAIATLPPDAEPGPEPPSKLRLLYLGRLERRKGVQNLVRALMAIDSEQIELSILGGDTQTAALGTSMAAQLQMAALDDPRITFLEPVARDRLGSLIEAHDIVVLPSLWEAWPYVGLEALRLNRPLIATPVGGFTEIVKARASGWLTADTGPESLTALLERLLFARDEVADLSRRETPRQIFAALTDGDEIRDEYAALIERGGRWSVSGAARASLGRSTQWPPRSSRAQTVHRIGNGKPLVSIIIPYYQLAEHVEETVQSALGQTHERTEVLIINDGSSLEADSILAELSTEHPITVLGQVNRGLGAARNFGISQARGSFVLPLDADNVLESTFVTRALEAFETDPSAVYVTSWSRYIDERGRELPNPNIGYQPIGNEPAEVLRNNVAGDAAAMLRHELFGRGIAYSEELTSYEDWYLYQQLHVMELYGLVIPDRLVRYRVRTESMIREIGLPRAVRLTGELAARRRETEVEWTSKRD